MGNQFQSSCQIQTVQKLNLPAQEKENLQIYLWRAQTNHNMYIPKVIFNQQQHHDIKKNFICTHQKHTNAPKVLFEQYLCDFRQLKYFLYVSQLLTVFKMVLKGQQTIFKKFRASIVSQKCTFITLEGQIRVWINPNYYLNQFWTVQIQRRQNRSKSQFLSDLSHQTPRFMNRQKFESKSAGLIMSDHTLIKKIVQLMLQLARNSVQCQRFKKFIENQVNLYNSNENKFSQVECLIDQYARQNNIKIKNNIQQAVKRLVSQGVIFGSDKCSLRSNKGSRKASNLLQSKNNAVAYKNQIQSQLSNVASILDLKSQSIIGTNNPHKMSNIRTQILSSMAPKQQYFETQQTQNTLELIKSKSFGKTKPNQHKRKLSKSLMQYTTRFDPNKIENLQSNPLETFIKIDQHTNRNPQSQTEIQKPKRKLSYNFQYSINLYTNQNKIPQTKNITLRSLQFRNNDLPCPTESSHHFRQNSQQTSSNLNGSNTSRPSSILKNPPQNSYEVNRSFNGFLESHYSEGKNQKLGFNFEEPIKFDNFKDAKSKQFCVSTFQTDNLQNSGGEKTMQKSVMLGSKLQRQFDKIINNSEDTKKTTIMNRLNSSLNKWSIQQQRPFQQITNHQIYIGATNGVQNGFSSKTIINNQSRIGIHNHFHRTQTSMLVNVKHNDKLNQESVIKSKRRVSVGAENQIQTQMIGSEENNFIGDATTKINNDHNPTSKTISRLMSQNKLHTSIGSFSSFSDSQKPSELIYTGILTKMGRSVPFRNLADEQIKRILEQQKDKDPPYISQPLVNFSKHKKKPIVITHQHTGVNRSMKL